MLVDRQYKLSAFGSGDPLKVLGRDWGVRGSGQALSASTVSGGIPIRRYRLHIWTEPAGWSSDPLAKGTSGIQH